MFFYNKIMEIEIEISFPLYTYVSNHMPSDICCITHTCPLNIYSECGKREAHKDRSTVTPEKAAPITGVCFQGPELLNHVTECSGVPP